MDPLSVLSSVASLVGIALHGINRYNQFRDRYSNAAITIASMTAQCSCIEFALLQIQDAIIHNPESAFRLRSEKAFVKHFLSVFGASQLVFSIINQRFNELLDASVTGHGEMTRIAKMKHMWNETEMKDLLRNLESQAGAINLLLSALQMRSNAEMSTLLDKPQSKSILDKASDDAKSLATSRGANNRDSLQTTSYCSSFDDTDFSFDFEVINTSTYRRAFHSRAISTLKQIDSKNTSQPGASIPKASVEVILPQDSKLPKLVSVRCRANPDVPVIIGQPIELEVHLPDQIDWGPLLQGPEAGEKSPSPPSISEAMPTDKPDVADRIDTADQTDAAGNTDIAGRQLIKRKPVGSRKMETGSVEKQRIFNEEVRNGASVQTPSIEDNIGHLSSTYGFIDYVLGGVTQEYVRRNVHQKVVSVRKIGSNQNAWTLPGANPENPNNSQQLSMKLIPRLDSTATPLIASSPAQRYQMGSIGPQEPVIRKRRPHSPLNQRWQLG